MHFKSIFPNPVLRSISPLPSTSASSATTEIRFKSSSRDRFSISHRFCLLDLRVAVSGLSDFSGAVAFDSVSSESELRKHNLRWCEHLWIDSNHCSRITHLRMTWSASMTWLETPTCAATADGDSNLANYNTRHLNKLLIHVKGETYEIVCINALR